MRTILYFAFCLAALVGAAPVGAQDYRVIVHEAAPVSELSRDELARVFMKKKTTWSDGSTVVVVDQSERSPVRARFSMSVLQRDVPAMKNYWQQSLFSGRGIPPVEQPSDAQVIQYVASHPGAIGYVSSSAELPAGIKTIAVR